MLIRQLRRPFHVVRSTHHETTRRGAAPSATVVRNAVEKARSAVIPARACDGIVIGADTIVYIQGRIIGKPGSSAKAYQFLRLLSGRSHWVYTGLCLRDLRSGCVRTSYEKTKVVFRPLTPRVIERLIARGSPLDKAGGYAIQEDRGELIARIEGSRTNVVGLPMELLRRELAALQSVSSGC